MLQLKRAYDQVEQQDGRRILVDRLWPRGLSKDKAKIDHWAKELAPSTELRKWFAHDPGKWIEFKRRYLLELKPFHEALVQIAAEAKIGTVTLIYAAKDQEHNEAVVLKALIEELKG